MNSHDIPPRCLEGTSLGAPLARLRQIYERIEEAQAKWIAATPYRCPSGCGSCCGDFEPDVLEIEAFYLAAHLSSSDPERFASLAAVPVVSAEREGCVFAKPDGEYHCTVYGGRPLVCRLFAFSGDRAKDGTARFRPCAKMASDGPRGLDEAALLSRFGLLPPIMSDFAGEAESLLPEGAGKRLPLREALPRAAAKIRYLSDLAASSAFAVFRSRENGDGDNDNPGGGSPPLPRAS